MLQGNQSFFAVNRTYDLYELIRGEVETVKAYVVDAATVGKKTSIFPTVSFIEPSEDGKKLGLFQYVLTEKDEEGKEQGVATSVTFTTGLTEDSVNALDLEYKVDENGDHYFDMDRDFFINRIPNLNVSGAYEKLGTEYFKATSVENTAVFTIPAQSEESGEVMVIYSTVELDKDQFEVANKTENYKTGSLVLNIQALTLGFNIEIGVKDLCENLANEYAVEPVSLTIVKQIASGAAYKLANRYVAIVAPELLKKEETISDEGLVGDETDAPQPQVAE